MGGVDLKDQLLQSYLIERKRNAKWYMKGKKVDQFFFRIQSIEELLIKYAKEDGYQQSGRHPSDNKLLHFTERHFMKRIPHLEQNYIHKEGVLCVLDMERGRTPSTGAKNVKLASASIALRTITLSSIIE
ncbi:hypothetical protein J437_LFUL016567, partial [Ladona fulva]